MEDASSWLNPSPRPAAAPLDAVAVSACLSDLQAALHHEDADGLLAALRPVADDPRVPRGSLDNAGRQAAVWFLQARRWNEALAALACLAQPTDQDAHLRNVAGNFAALREHRPALAEQLEARLPAADAASADATAVLPTMSDASAYRLFRDEGGVLRVVCRGENGQYAVVPPAGRWPAFLKQVQATLADHPGAPLGLLSVGDGAALTWLAQNPPTLFMDQALAVHVFEPDVDRLLMAMHLHDWAGPGGPIADARFAWRVGADWAASFGRACADRPWTPTPAQAVCPDPAIAEALGPELKRLSDEARTAWAGRSRAVFDAYARRDDESEAAYFGPNPPRTPRIAVLTSRFTTVLQYAARDSAAALRRLGWDARVFMESSPHERFAPAALTELFESFAPDALFTIDTPRKFIESVVPPGVPVLFWIQDALPRLMNRDVGRSVTDRDFVLTFFAPRLVHDHGYPARQCLDMPMMVTNPRPSGADAGGTEPIEETADALATAWSARTGPDLLYASNVSATVDGLVEQTVSKAKGDQRRVLEIAARRMVAWYDEGGSLPTEPDIDALLDDLVEQGAIPGHPPATRRGLRDALWNPLNTGLYRQQALGWVADLAEREGLRLNVHGRGWSTHPRFAAYDRGPLDHAGLQTATAEAEFVLHLEPYICFTHHRMLDALQAGTPVLVRDHPGHVGLQRVAAFLAEHTPHAASDDRVREALAADDAQLTAYARLTAELRGVTWDLAGDVAAQVRAWQGAGVLPDADGAEPAMPGLETVSFGNAEGLAARWTALRADPPAVGRLLLEQRAAVDARLTFDAALRRVLAQVHERLG
ncbi:MAG: hypothetical protein AAGE65_00930 [Planctomycetota bacterium]